MSGHRSRSPRGRYLRGDKCPGCLGDEPHSSRLEIEVFTLLHHVLGAGEQNVAVPSDGRMHLDMRFRQDHGPVIGVEYDGAYWHAGKEISDTRKARRVVSERVTDVVMRIREEPLTILSSEDVVVRRNESASTIATVALLHLVHMDVVDSVAAQRVADMVSASATTISEQSVTCDDCWLLDGSFRHADPDSRWNDIDRRHSTRRRPLRRGFSRHGSERGYLR